jgi:hypothetical protein
MSGEGRTEKLGHQGTDVKLAPIRWTVIVFVLVMVGLHWGVWSLYRYARDRDENRDVRRTFVEAAPPVPPEPRLQVNPAEDFQEYLKREEEILKTYGWVSREQGQVHIPIERAMEMVVEMEKHR